MQETEEKNPESETSEEETPEVAEVKTEATEPEADTLVAEEEEPEVEAIDTGVAKAEETETEETEIVEAKAPEPASEKKSPNILQRILLWAAIVIAAVFLLLGLAGIIGAWAINTPVTETILAILQPIDNTLQRLEVAAGEADSALSEVSMSLDDAEQQVQDLGAGLAETNLVAEALSRIFDVDVEQKVGNAQEGVRSIYDTVVAVEETVNAINAIPFLDVEVPGSAEVAGIRTGMEEMAASAAELREETQQKREERAENLVQAISAPLNRLQDRVDEIHTRITSTEERLGLAVENIDEIQSRVPGWIDIISIIATLLLAWLMFSQGAVIALCWRAMYG